MNKSSGKSRDTQAWVRSVMETAITSKWQAPSKTLNEEIDVGLRLASLYGSNTSSNIVKKRSKKTVERSKPLPLNSPIAKRRQEKKEMYSTVTFMAEPSTGGPANPAIKIDSKSSPPLRYRKIPLEEEGEVQSRVSAEPRWKRDKVPTDNIRGWYVGNRSAEGCPSPGYMSRVPRYGLEATLKMAQRERPAMFSPIGRVKYMPKFLHRIPTSNVWSPPIFGSPGSWPSDVGNTVTFKEARGAGEKGDEVITARNLRSVKHELEQVDLIYRSVNMERAETTQKLRRSRRRDERAEGRTDDGTLITNTHGRGSRTAISSKRRNGVAKSSQAGRMKSTWGSFDDFNKRNSQSPSRSLSSSSQTFPKTLQDFIQQKQWERFDVETEQKRVRTAHTQRLRAERYANKYGLDLEKHVKKLFPTKSRSKEELQALPHHKAPKSIRMTTKYVPPITKLKYMSGLTAIYARKDTTSGGGLPVAEKAAKDRELRLKKRWQALKQMHRIIRLPQNRKPGLEDITNLCETFEKVLLHNDDPLICDRDTFVRVIMQMYIKTDHKSINQLYSSLDPDRTDRLDYRDFIACLRIFRVPTESAVSKLKALWNIYGRINGLTNNNECKLSKNEIKQILFTCTATLTEKELLDDAISAKVGKQLRAETKLHQRQQYVNRESFLGLAYVECSGIGACLGGGQRSMSGKTSFGIKLSFDELLNALNERLDVETQFYNQLKLRLKEGGFEGEPAKRRKPPPEKIDTSIPNPSAERLKVLMSSPSHTI